jgi:hypothetical protein
MNRILLAGAAAAALLSLGSCATMSEDQCLAGDWGQQGYNDGYAGLSESRLEDHAKACEKYGVVPNSAAYFSAREDGLRGYCVPERAFSEAARGNSYAGVCRGPVEGAFLSAWSDGESLYRAEQAVSEARSRIDSLGARAAELDEKIDYFQGQARDDSLTDEAREQARNRVRELRREREQTIREWRDAQDYLDYAEREARDVRFYLMGRYSF